MTIRVMVVDDSAVIRRVVAGVISAEDDMEVVAQAADGRAALEVMAEVRPDRLTLDVEMPKMNGVDTVRALRGTHRRLPVIIFSTLTERGAQVTVEALLAGANDYVTKPSHTSSISDAQAQVRASLIPKIRMLGARAMSAGRPEGRGPVAYATGRTESPPVTRDGAGTPTVSPPDAQEAVAPGGRGQKPPAPAARPSAGLAARGPSRTATARHAPSAPAEPLRGSVAAHPLVAPEPMARAGRDLQARDHRS